MTALQTLSGLTVRELIHMLADAVRWWGFLAGVLMFHDTWKRARLWREGGGHPPILNPWLDAGAKFGTAIFLVMAGLGIPVARRYGIDLLGPAFESFMLVAWFAVSAGGWAYVGSRAPRPWVMFWVAAGTFLTTVAAAAASA